MRRVSYRLLVLVSTAVLLLDQLTKEIIIRNLELYEALPVLPNFFHITHVRNQGAAFGILANHALRLPVLLGASLLAAVGICWYYRQFPPERRWLRWGLSLILGGALGNMIDRLRFGAVIDFLDVHWYQYHWPAFNVADSAITIGVVLLLVDCWRPAGAGNQGAAS
jgi:signal peptidase II